MAKVFIRFKSGFELPITCDEFKLKTACGEILSYDIKGIEDNKPLFFRMEDVECIYQRRERMDGEQDED